MPLSDESVNNAINQFLKGIVIGIIYLVITIGIILLSLFISSSFNSDHSSALLTIVAFIVLPSILTFVLGVFGYGFFWGIVFKDWEKPFLFWIPWMFFIVWLAYMPFNL